MGVVGIGEPNSYSDCQEKKNIVEMNVTTLNVNVLICF